VTLREALLISRQTGQDFQRDDNVRGYGGWVRWDKNWTYRFSAEDLVADDWQPLSKPNKERSGQT
jgi:hypothetical protein